MFIRKNACVDFCLVPPECYHSSLYFYAIYNLLNPTFDMILKINLLSYNLCYLLLESILKLCTFQFQSLHDKEKEGPTDAATNGTALQR